MASKQKSLVVRGWGDVEHEVAHYFQNEPGGKTQSFEGAIMTGYSEPLPPRFLPGADFWTMMTVADRLPVADRIMPCRGNQYTYELPGLGEHGVRPRQQLKRMGQPSAAMVLRARYGPLACKYDDSAPDGAKLLTRAQEAYVRAAQQVPARRYNPDKLRIAQNAKWDRAFAAPEQVG